MKCVAGVLNTSLKCSRTAWHPSNCLAPSNNRWALPTSEGRACIHCSQPDTSVCDFRHTRSETCDHSEKEARPQHCALSQVTLQFELQSVPQSDALNAPVI